MDEIDAKLAIYRWNLGQNSCWNLKLPFKINFGRWITIWKQSGRWIYLLTLGFKSGRRITIWKQSGHWISLLTLGFKSGRDLGRQITLEREGRFFAKNWWYIADKSATHRILRRFFDKIADLSCVADFLAIFGEKSPRRLISSICHFATRRHAIYQRYFAHFFPIFSSLIMTMLSF